MSQPLERIRKGMYRLRRVICPCGKPAFRGGYCSLYCEVAAVVEEADRPDPVDADSPAGEHDRAYHGRCGDDV